MEKVDTRNTRPSESESVTDAKLRYGCCGIRPHVLQKLNTITWAVFFLSLANCLQNATNGLLGVSLTTLEKRFNFSSTMSSMIASAYEFGQVPAVLLIMAYGNRIHRPKFIGLGMFCVGLGCVLFFMPQFFVAPYVPTDVDADNQTVMHDMCVTNKQDRDFEPCPPPENVLSRYLPFFILGRFLIGVGATPVLTIGLTFINDCSTKEKFAIYSGVYNAMSIVGPAIGVLSASFLLNVFVDFYRIDVNSFGFDDDDPRWIGNWWSAYIVLALLSVLSAIPLLGFPNDLPGAKAIRAGKESEAAAAVVTTKKEGEAKGMRIRNPFLKNLRQLLTNFPYLLACVFSICDMLIIIGFNAFGPKVFENLLRLPPHAAGLTFGMALLPAGMVGTILGGYLIMRYKMSCKQIILVQTGFSIASLLLFSTILIVCPANRFAGGNYPTSKFDTALGLENECNQHCMCDRVDYQPICSIDDIQYYSPCHAGCKGKRGSLEHEGIHEFYNCSCIRRPDGNMNADAIDEPCRLRTCKKAILFLISFTVIVCCMFICFTMNTSVIIRLVKGPQAASAVGFQVLVTKLLGTVPGPLLFGKAIDLSCALWEPSNCVTNSSKCIVFHVEVLSRNILFICIVPKLFACLAMVILNAIYRPPVVAKTVEQEVESLSSGSVEQKEAE